ncbi:MAG: hypothetical protein LJE85_15580 [Gammaproteobacteria bacterium]|jgi:hypothetical protein|nr:hypothetical protein [Gammaproteobacteria bacterium]
MKAIYLVAGFGVALFSTPLFAEDTAQAKQFNKLDKDNDGSITMYEAKEHVDMLKSWEDFDKNANGKLEFSEFSAFEARSDQTSKKAKTFVPPENNDDYDLGAAPF